MAQVLCPKCGAYGVRTYSPMARFFGGLAGGFIYCSIGLMLGGLITVKLGEMVARINLLAGDIITGLLGLGSVGVGVYVGFLTIRPALEKGYDHQCGICGFTWHSIIVNGPPTES